MSDIYKLYIFDLDGTLSPFSSGDWFPEAKTWWDTNFNSLPVRPVVATNQGGIGLRYWMEKDGFGEPEKYPTDGDFIKRVSTLFPDAAMQPHLLASYRYQSKKSGKWSPVPPEWENAPDARCWGKEYRKPAPGMLIHAMELAGIDKSDTLFVGDRDEDRQAAKAAGVDFEWAKDFFGLESRKE